MANRYYIDRDEDAHYYMIPVGLSDEFEAHVESDGILPLPYGVIEIQAPYVVSFSDPAFREKGA